MASKSVLLICVSFFGLKVTLADTCDSANGNLDTVYSWDEFQFSYPSDEEREEAIVSKEYIPGNVICTGMAVSDEYVVLTFPRWCNEGIPATVAYFNRTCTDTSPKLIPFPSFEMNRVCNDGESIISVISARFDKWNRLWLLDYGKIGFGEHATRISDPKILIYDMGTKTLITSYTLKDTDFTCSSMFTHMTLDIGKTSDDVYAYIIEKTGIICYSLKLNDAWRFDHSYFGVDPVNTYSKINDDAFLWNNEGINTIAVSPVLADGTRIVFFHSFSSLFKVSNQILHDKTNVDFLFQYVGSREKLGLSTIEVIDKDSVQFSILRDENAVSCWKPGHPYTDEDVTIVAEGDEDLTFISCKGTLDGYLWVLAIKRPNMTLASLNSNEVNFKILRAKVTDLKEGTPYEVCN